MKKEDPRQERANNAPVSCCEITLSVLGLVLGIGKTTFSVNVSVNTLCLFMCV